MSLLSQMTKITSYIRYGFWQDEIYDKWRFSVVKEQRRYSKTSLSRQARGEGLAELAGIPT